MGPCCRGSPAPAPEPLCEKGGGLETDGATHEQRSGDGRG